MKCRLGCRNRYFRWSFLSALSGVLAGLSATAFLSSLEWATTLRDRFPVVIWALPAGGFVIGWVYHFYGKDVAAGHNLILDEIHDPRKVVPARMAPLTLFATVVTHLFGGSAGREGAIVQMGASLSDQLTRIFKIEPEERKILLTTGAGAGFGAAIGAPWAGVIFGMEVIQVGRLNPFAWFECLIASFVGYGVVRLLGVDHLHFAVIDFPSIGLRSVVLVSICGIIFGGAARFFVMCTHAIESTTNRWISYPPLKPVLGGALLSILFWLDGSYHYVGLGMQYIQEALISASSIRAPILKTFFSALTIGTGFKGGEFVPLVYVGTTLGSALSVVLPLSCSFLGALGFAAVFGAAANTPITCTVMAAELFGYRIAVFAWIACFVSYYFSGGHGIYRSQKIHLNKHERLLELASWLGELPKRFT